MLKIVKIATDDKHIKAGDMNSDFIKIKAIGTLDFIDKIESKDDNFFEDLFKDGDMDANFKGRNMGAIIFKYGTGPRRGERGWATPVG